MNAAPSPASRRISRIGACAIGAAALALVVCAPFAWRFVRAGLMKDPLALEKARDVGELAAQHAASFEGYVKQLDGRSLYYEPSAPGTEGEVVADVTEDIDPNDPAPTRYDGPSIVAIVLDSVWFSDGQRVKSGGKGSGGLEVVSTNAPWDAKVNWHGTEFTVPFFERDKVILKSAKPTNSSTISTSTPSAAPAPPDANGVQPGAVSADAPAPPASEATPVAIPMPAAGDAPSSEQPVPPPAPTPVPTAEPTPQPTPDPSSPPPPPETPR